MRIRGIGTARRVAGWVRSRVRGGPIVLGYHQVYETGWDPQRLCVAPENFTEQLEILTSRARPARLDELVTSLVNRQPLKNAFVITIDDGYVDTLEAALPILERFEVPATVFITTGLVGQRFWWCEVQQLVEQSANLPDAIRIKVGGHGLNWRRRSNTLRDRARLVQTMGDFFRALPFELQDEAFAAVRECFDQAISPSSTRAMNEDEIRKLSSHELIEIGSHCISHTSLNLLDVESQTRELLDSKSQLESICGKEITSCSYPNGRVSQESPRLARNAGYRAGCCSNEELVDDACDPMMLPRVWVGDRGGNNFEKWLRWWI